jgi:hypothetical protein
MQNVLHRGILCWREMNVFETFSQTEKCEYSRRKHVVYLIIAESNTYLLKDRILYQEFSILILQASKNCINSLG